MKKIIATIDDTGNLVDDTNAIVTNLSGMNYTFTDFDAQAEEAKTAEPVEDQLTVIQLISLGITPDEIIKMKVNKVL